MWLEGTGCVWDAERHKVSMDGGFREMSGEYIYVVMYGIGIEGCVGGMSWEMEVCFI